MKNYVPKIYDEILQMSFRITKIFTVIHLEKERSFEINSEVLYQRQTHLNTYFALQNLDHLFPQKIILCLQLKNKK